MSIFAGSKSTAAKRAYDSSPEFQRLVAENKQLRAIAHRVTKLESRADDTDARLDAQEEWNSERDSYVKQYAPIPDVKKCPGCERTFPVNTVSFPNMGRARAMELGTDRLCWECLSN
jgi:hypothetical protein